MDHKEQLKLANQFVNDHGYDLSKYDDAYIAKFASENGRDYDGTFDFTQVLNKVAVQRAMSSDKKSEIPLKDPKSVAAAARSPYFKPNDLHKEVKRDTHRVAAKPIQPKKSINTATGQSDQYTPKVASVHGDDLFSKIANELSVTVLELPKTIDEQKALKRMEIVNTWASKRYMAIMELLKYLMDNYHDDFKNEVSSVTMANSKLGILAKRHGVDKNILIDVIQTMFREGLPPEFFWKWDNIGKFRREGIIANEFYNYAVPLEELAYAKWYIAMKTAHYLAEHSVNGHKIIELISHYFHLTQREHDLFTDYYIRSNKILHNDSVYTLNPEIDYSDEAGDFRNFNLKDVEWYNNYDQAGSRVSNNGLDFTHIVRNTIKTLQENYAYQVFLAMYDYLDNKLEGVIND